jgi:PAS domain S-box-containing protein
MERMATDTTRDELPIDGPVEVLYVDDRSQTRAVADFVDSAYDDMTVVGATDREAARKRAKQDSFDCIVVELKYATAVNDVTEGAPLVLFTETDPTAISDDLLDQADTLVQKGEETHIDFLVDKVCGVVAGADTEETGTERIASTVPDARTEFFVLDADGRIRWSSAPADEVFPPVVTETASEKPLHDRLTAAATGEYGYADRLAEAVATGSGVSRVGLSLPREGPPSEPETVTYSVWSHPLDGGERRLEAYRDVTGELQQGERLERLEQLVELASDGLYMLDADARYSFVTDRYAEMLGYERGELLGRHASAVMSEGALGHGQKAVESLLNDPDRDSAVVDQVHQRKDGSRIRLSIHFTVVTEEDGSYGGLMGVARDVTERRQREQELAEYETVFETVFDRVYVLDGEGTVRLANEPFASLLGATTEDIEGSRAVDVFGAENYETIQSLVREVSQSSKGHCGAELTLTDADGNEIPCETYVAELPEERGGGCVGVVRDISERVQREQQVAVLDRVLRHNLRNDLTVVLGRAELLADRLTDDETREMLETIQRRSNRLMEFAEKARRAQRVLDHALTKRPNPVDVIDVVERVQRRVADSHPEATIRATAPADCTATVPQTVNIALTDLVKNAVEHNDRANPDVEIRVECREAVVEIAVVDDGPGIPSNELDVLINGTETPLKHGSGIGFWLVHWIVSQCNGDLSVESRRPRGSVVRMRVPHDGE